MNSKMGLERVVILYGSQTGTAEDTAESLGRRLKIRRDHVERNYVINVLPMDDYPIRQLVQEQTVIFICSTTGQGEEPENMKRFWTFLLRKDLPVNSLNNLQFAVLGLGDSSYVQFNFVAKKLFRRLLQLGASPRVKLALADDQHDLGVDAVFEPWSVALLDLLIPMSIDVDIINQLSVLARPKYKISVCNVDITMDWHDMDEQLISDRHDPVRATLVGNERVTTPTHFQDVRLIKLDVSFKNDYAEGDVLMVQPQNLVENIEDFFRILPNRLGPDTTIILEAVDDPDNFSRAPKQNSSIRCKWRQCVQRVFDLQAVPKRYFYEILRHFSPDELEREKLSEFLSTEGQRDLYNYGAAMRRTCLEALQDFPLSAQAVPCEYYFDLFPTIKARAFSIASSSSVFPDQVHLLVAVVEYQTKLVKARRGLCSNWLSRLRPENGDRISVWLRKGSFRFPNDPLTPVLMIGPGTGCAPFRSYLQRRVQFLKHPGSHLFFGCRNKKGDFYFEEEWSTMQADGLVKLYVAFSRDQEEKRYVQHKLLENGQTIWELINKKAACIFLAGSAKQMPQDVRDALEKVFVLDGNLSDVAAKDYMKKLERTRRFQSETWS